jgi:transcriptional regulator with PAS, ATPase and Fis domain
MALLMAHDYPGNIRELENIIEHGFVLCRDGEITAEHLPAYLDRDASRRRTSAVLPASLGSAVQSTEERMILEALERHGYNRKAAAAELGMHKSTLHRKLNTLKITLPAIDGRSGRPPR